MSFLSPSRPYVQSVNSDLAGIVTECGSIRIWNLNESAIFLSTSCKDILNAGGVVSSVASFYVTEVGVPIILLTNGYSFSYSRKLDSWLTLNSRDPIIRHGLSTAPQNPIKDTKGHPLNYVQTVSYRFTPTNQGYRDV